MKRLLMMAMVLILSDARAHTKPRSGQDLWNCDANLSASSVTMRRFARLFGRYTVTDLADFAGTSFEHHDVRRDRITLTMPDLSLPVRAVHKQRLHEGEDFWLFDVGFKSLERDAKAVNRFAARQLLAHADRSLRFENSARRRSVLETLHRFRWAFHDEVLDTYRNHRGKSKYLGARDFDQMIAANQNGNVDVLGVVDRNLDEDATTDEIRRSLVMSLQISYEQPSDFMWPTRDGMLAALGEDRLGPKALPFMYRLDAGRKDDFIDWFWAKYGHLRVCEIARLAKTPEFEIPRVVEARLFVEALTRVIARRCQIVVANQDSAVFRLFQEYGFDPLRRLPTATDRERLVVLDVSSTKFWTNLRELARATGRVVP